MSKTINNKLFHCLSLGVWKFTKSYKAFINSSISTSESICASEKFLLIIIIIKNKEKTKVNIKKKKRNNLIKLKKKEYKKVRKGKWKLLVLFYLIKKKVNFVYNKKIS